jgi:ATP phosphoribosyltransferase regulatory subunit HisZ
MYERNDGLMRGSREERIQKILDLHEYEWDFDTLLGIIQGLLDHAEDVRLATMETLLEIAGQKKVPMSLSSVSVIEYFMFSFNASTKAAQRIFRFLVDNTDIPGANEAIKRSLLRDVRNEDFEKFIDIIVEARKLEFLKALENKKLSKTKAKILKNALNH